MAAKARRATTAKLQVVKIFGFRSLNNPRSGPSGSATRVPEGRRRHANRGFSPIVSICGGGRGGFHGQINPRCLRNIFLFYSTTAKTIGNMFNLVN